MADIANTEVIQSVEIESKNYLAARDETGAKVNIPWRQKADWGFGLQSVSRFEDSGVRTKIVKEEVIPLVVDSNLKADDVISIKNEMGSIFHYQITEKPKSASPPKNESGLKTAEDKYLKRLTLVEYNVLKYKEVPISTKETETKVNGQILKNIAVEITK